MPTWEGATCPFCSKGIAGPLQDRDSGLDERVVKSSSRRSTSILCFPQQEGRRGISLGLQAGVLLLLLAGVAASAIHLVTQVNHKVVERLKRSLDLVRKGYVEHVQSTMSFGGRNNAWQDVEVDEAVFDKTLIPIEQAECPSKTVEWEQWVGLVQRGKPTSLILLRLSPKPTNKRSPGPGPIRKNEWRKIADKWLKDKHVLKTATLPGGRKITVKLSTQVIDRCWRFVKERLCVNQNVKTGSMRIQAQVRSAQSEYWHTGDLVTWYMRKIIV
ncbi:unnamed protein product [Symbiodinium necroappetens]|uniref:Uncharacterized protein n=1 Tax=Symbiodinium necroappetens TaxID=1628268 RepID=A0A812Y5I2_9DINO|nr:unnamed protein product [Symbiodinium necroappetens]